VDVAVAPPASPALASIPATIPATTTTANADGIAVQAGETSLSLNEGGLAVNAPSLGVVVDSCGACETPAAQTSRDEPLVPLTVPEAAAATSLAAVLLAALAWLARCLVLGVPFFAFSRIEDDALAAHPQRRRALDYITANPGANIAQVRRALGLAWGTTVYHLSRLERAGLVAVRHVGGQRTHWPLGSAPAKDALPGTGRTLARLVHERPGLAQRELAQLAGIGAAAACKQLARLQSAGLVLAQRDGRSLRYVGTPMLAAQA
jgi:DNA-binding transcriptional ArsR family regulator